MHTESADEHRLRTMRVPKRWYGRKPTQERAAGRSSRERSGGYSAVIAAPPAKQETSGYDNSAVLEDVSIAGRPLPAA